MANKIRFRDYGGDCEYAKAEARKLDLALPKEVIDNKVAREEIKRLKLTTWQYNVNGSTCEGTFYWNDGEKAWKYYEKGELLGILMDNGEAEAAAVLESYLNDPANWDDDFPHFTNEGE